MSTTTVVPPPSTASRLALIWPILGAFFLLLQVYIYTAWMLSDDFRPVDPGPDPIPGYSLWGIRIYEALSIITLIVTIPWFINGIRKKGKIDNFRLMMLGWLATWWSDPWLNFLEPMFTYNAYAVNMGCWCNFIPFWQSGDGQGLPNHF